MTAIVLALLIVALLVAAGGALVPGVTTDARVRLGDGALALLVGAILLQPLVLAIQAA